MKTVSTESSFSPTSGKSRSSPVYEKPLENANYVLSLGLRGLNIKLHSNEYCSVFVNEIKDENALNEVHSNLRVVESVIDKITDEFIMG